MKLPKEGWSSRYKIHPDNAKDRPRKGKVFGLCVHTSGRGVNKRAKREKKHVDEVALDYYDDAKYSTHYIVGIEDVWQLTNDFERVQHVGFSDKKRGRNAAQLRQWYLSGKWAKDLPKSFVQRWKEAWPGKKSPSHLFPSKYPSDDFVAAEVIPCEGFAAPIAPGYLFTAAQHVSVALLAVDLSIRHNWPHGWASTSRLCTHESLGPHDRIARGQGWDPGVLRAKPYFDWSVMQAQIRMFQTMIGLSGSPLL